MFSEYLKQFDWDTVSREISAMNGTDVERALSASRPGLSDFMALVSPAAAPYLEHMARRSRRLTERRFGRTVSMFIPMYITNSCNNGCVYCGFNRANRFRRVVLSRDEIERECVAIRSLAPFDNLLIVTGENPAVAGTGYIRQALGICGRYFSNLSIEVMPLTEDDYVRLAKAGLNGVVCFQETYHRERYGVYHPVGRKHDFEWRVNAFDRMGRAGLHRIGLGVLIGLEDWRTDMVMMALHVAYLRKHYWRTRYSVNFPRMRPSESGFQPNVVMSDRELAQATFAFRIFDPDLDISYSTREDHDFRIRMATLGVTTLSAGSRTDPGGYAARTEALEQFAVSDEASPEKVAADLRAVGREPVWKDWDRALIPELIRDHAD